MTRTPFTLAAMSVCLAFSAHADTGTYHRCPIEGEGAAEIYMDANGREVTFDVRGERYEIRAQGGRFKLRVGPRTYAFAPRFLTPPGVLVITTPDERRTVRCLMP